MQYMQMLKDSFGALKDKANRKYILAYLIATAVFLVITFGSIGIGILFPPFMIIRSFLSPLLTIAYVLAIFYLTFRIILKALKSFGLGTAPLSVIKILAIILIGILLILIALFSFGLIVALPAILVGGIISIALNDMFLAAIIGLLIGLGMLLIWIILLIYVSVRIFLYLPIYLSKEIGIIASIKESWKITKGNFWNIVIANIVLWLALLLVNIALFVVLIILAVIAAILIIILGAIIAALGADQFISLVLIGLVAGLIAIIAMVFNTIVEGAILIVQNYYLVAIYKEVLGNSPKTQPKIQKPQAPAQKPVAQKPISQPMRSQGAGLRSSRMP